MKGVFFDILPRMIGMAAEADKIVVESEKAGEKAGKAWSGMFSKETASATSKSVESMKAQVNSGISALESASARAVKAHDSEADAAGRARIAEMNLGKVRQKYSEDSVQYVRAEEALAKAKRDTATASGAAQTAALSENKAMDELAAKQTVLKTKQDETAKSSGAMATAMKGAATLGVGALVVGVGESVKAAGDFQASQTRLVTTAGESQQNLAGVSQGILQLSGQLGVSAEDLSKGMYTIESAGYHGQAGLQVLKAAGEGARQENADLKDVTDALTTSMHDFNIAPDQSAVVMSKMVAAVSQGKTTLGEFSGALHSVEPAAHAAGISLDDVYATLAMMTRTGESAEQSTQNMNDAIRHLASPTQQMTEEMSQFGISSADVQQKLGERGLTGTMGMLADAVKSKMTPAQQIVIDTFNKNNQVVADANRIFQSLPPAAQAVAQSVKDGSLSFTDFRKTGGGLAVDQKNMVDQWWALEKRAEGFNSVLKSGKSDIQTYQQALNLMTGTVAGSTVAMDITGDNADATRQAKAGIASAKPGAGGDIAGWSEVQGNFNQKLAQTKASLEATAIAVGTDLLPAVTKFLGYLQDGTGWLEKHKIAADGVVAAFGALTGAWAIIKVGQGIWGGLTTVAKGATLAIKGVGTAASTAGSLISSGAGMVKNVATSAMDWWAWTGKARAAAVADFVATKTSAVTESLASGAAWVGQGAKAAGAWTVMQAKAVGAFVATKASAVGSAAATGAAWLASNAKAAASFALTAGRAIAAATATGAVTAAQWLWNVAMDANPVGLVVLGVTALVGGIVLLVKHWKDVTEGWDWTYKNVLTPVGHWFQHTWNDDIVPPFKTATDDITGFFKGMGTDIHAVWVDIVHGIAWTVDKIADVLDALPSSIHIPGTDISTPNFKGMGADLHGFSSAAMDYKANGGEVASHPGYGLFRGKGGPRDDANLVAMSDHEWVVDADGTARNRGVLERIKAGEKIVARADGGLVGDSDITSLDAITNSPDSTSTASAAASVVQSGLQVALNAIRSHIDTMYVWGGGTLSSGVDCSGLVGDAQLLATGQSPDHRLGTTDTLLGGGWPGMIKGATNSDYFIVGVNDHHMVGKILGEGIEARQSGEHIRMGSEAADPFDQQFIAQYHLDPSLINPPYEPGASGDPTATGGDFTGLSPTGTSASDKAARYRAAAQKELDLAKKHDAMAQADMTKATQYKDGLPAAKAKHLDAMKRYLAEAQHADDLAAKSTGDARQRHLDAAAHDRDLAAKAQAAAGKVGPQGQKYLDAATKARQEAADERKRAQEDLAKANQAMTATTKGKKGKSGLDANGGWMTLKQAAEHAADIGVDALTESTGLPDWMSDPNQSAVLRIGKQLTNIRPKGKTWTAPNWSASPFLPAQQNIQQQDLSDLLPATHDLGGIVPPGLSLVNNKTGGQEVYVINPQLMGQRQSEPVAAGRGRRSEPSGPALVIENYHAASDSQAEANRLGRTVGQYRRQR